MTTRKRVLWKTEEELDNSTNCVEEEEDVSYEAILARSSSRPPRKSLWRLCANALVVVQEVCLTSYLLERHHVALLADRNDPIFASSRQFQVNLERSTYFICLALLLVVTFSAKAERAPAQSKRTKVRQRLVDGVLLAVLLRFIASLLRNLSESYSSDTVQTLAQYLMLLHVFACDYSYANGKEPILVASSMTTQTRSMSLSNATSPIISRRGHQHHEQRPPFQGGTMSLNAALFATTLLVSRLKSNGEAFFLICISIVLFAFYPVPRSAISASYPAHSSPVMWIITGSVFVATVLIMMADERSDHVNNNRKRFLLISATLLLGFVVPCWKCFVAQKHKRLLRGPWDIPTAASMQLDYSSNMFVAVVDTSS